MHSKDLQGSCDESQNMSRCADEFLRHPGDSQFHADVYSLHPLFKCDDFAHFSERVYSYYSLHLYDIVNCDSGCLNLKRFGDATVVQSSSKCLKRDVSLECNLMVMVDRC